MQREIANCENRVHEQPPTGQDGISNFATRNYSRCGANKKSGGSCKNPAGLKTDHFGTGRCYLHGGCSTGPIQSMLGNKRAIKTGEYERIIPEALDEHESALYDNISTDTMALLDEEIRLCVIRECRMMKRIQELAQQEFTIVEQDAEIEPIWSSENQDFVGKRKLRLVSKNSLQDIMRVEETLTRVQLLKAKHIELKHKLEEGNGKDDSSINELAKALAESREMFGITAYN